MSDFDRPSPSIIGACTPIWALIQKAFENPGTALAMRVVPGAVSMNEWHSFLLLAAQQPGLAMEVVNDLAPAITRPTAFGQLGYYRPGNDTNAIVTNWTDAGGAAVNAGDVDNPQDLAAYARNSTALTKNTPRNLAFHANNAGALAGRRMLAVTVGGSVMLRKGLTNTDASLIARGILVDGGAAGTIITGPNHVIKATSRYSNQRLAKFALDPFLQQPWLVGEVDDYLDATDNELFGVQIQARAAALAVRVNHLFIAVDHCAENRMWYSYLNGEPEVGWHQQTLTSLLGALSANTYYWLVVSAPWAASGSKFTIPVSLGAPETPLSTSATGAGEHRGIYELTLAEPAGVPSSVPTIRPGFFPVLVGNSGTLNSQSQPYAGLDRIPVHISATANIGQQETTPGGGPHPIFGVSCAVGWQSSARPDAPLVVEIRSGVGAISGGGTLHGTCTLRPEDVLSPLTFVTIPVDGGSISLASSTQFHLIVRSSATSGTGWVVMVGDSRSDFLQATPTTTLAEVEGQTQGGQTDSYVEGGSAFDRYDLWIALVGAPAPPADVTATPIAAATTTREAWDASEPSHRNPYVEITWTPTALGSSFAAVRVLRRARSTPAEPWVEIMLREVRTGETAATVEANEDYFHDHAAGWGVTGQEWIEGWDYAVQVVDTLGRSSPLSGATDLANVVSPSEDDWIVVPREPWANARCRVGAELSGGGADTIEALETLGGGTLLRASEDGPPRAYDLRWSDLARASERVLHRHRVLATFGRTSVALRCRGERLIGMPTSPDRRSSSSVATEYGSTFKLGGTEADLRADGPNGPAEIVLDGSTGMGLVASHADLNPGTSPFTVMVHGIIPASANGNAEVLLSKRAGAAGYLLGTSANPDELSWLVEGASTNVLADFTDADLFGARHTYWLTYDQVTLEAFVDDESSARASQPGVAGAISNSLAMLLGALNDGSDGAAGSVMAASVRAIGYWPAVLSDAQRIATARYVLGYYDYRAYPTDRIFFDAADTRSWDSTPPRSELNNLGGSVETQHRLVLSGGWSRRARPWELRRLDEQRV